MNYRVKIPQQLRSELWWMIVNVDFDYGRISIADHEIDEDQLIIWLEDKHDFKNSLEDCLQVSIPLKQFAKVINVEHMNTYEAIQMHPKKKFLHKTRVIINEAISWYLDDATTIEQEWARQSLLKKLLTQLIESEIFVC